MPFTNQKYSVRRVIPFAMHGRKEMLGLPTLVVAAIVPGALTTSCFVTDYNQIPEGRTWLQT